MGEDYFAWDQEEIEEEDRQMRAAAKRLYGNPRYYPTRIVTQSDVRRGVCEDCGEPVGQNHAEDCPVLEKPTRTLEEARENIRKAGF